MNKSIVLIALVNLLVSCGAETQTTLVTNEYPTVDTVTQITSKESVQSPETDDLRSWIRSLQVRPLDGSDLYHEIIEVTEAGQAIDRNVNPWLFGLEKTDSIQFAQADLLYLKAKIYENESIVSVAFADIYDYKTALHIFTFSKPALRPTSSFIIYNLGGDGEDFWNIRPQYMDFPLYQVREEVGYDNSAITKGEYHINLQEDRSYKIDLHTGMLTKEIVLTKKNFKELRVAE